MNKRHHGFRGAMVLLAALLVASCSTFGGVGGDGYQGEDAVQLSASRGLLYTIDGAFSSNAYPDLFWTNLKNMKTNVNLEPGTHSFVFFINSSRETYAFTLDTEPGMRYKLSKGDPLKIEDDDGIIEGIEFVEVGNRMDDEKIYWLTDERDPDKVAFLTNDQAILFGSDSEYYVKRIDDEFGGTRLGFNSGWNGDFKVALDPGEHVIDGRITHRGMSLKVAYTMSHDFEAGESYELVFDEDKSLLEDPLSIVKQ